MKIFALETDGDKLTKSFLSSDENVVLMVRFHGFLFFMRMLRSFFFTSIAVGIGIGGWYVGIPLWIIITACLTVWFFAIFLPIITAFVDWKFDFLLLTNEKLVVVNQTSIFRREIRQMNLDNLASVNAHTQFGNLFPFGEICFDLKEGVGQRICYKYIPDAAHIASKISDGIVAYQRRRMAVSHQIAHENEPKS